MVLQSITVDFGKGLLIRWTSELDCLFEFGLRPSNYGLEEQSERQVSIWKSDPNVTGRRLLEWGCFRQTVYHRSNSISVLPSPSFHSFFLSFHVTKVVLELIHSESNSHISLKLLAPPFCKMIRIGGQHRRCLYYELANCLSPSLLGISATIAD